MKKDTDQLWRNKWSESPPGELMTDFDEEAIWQQIQQQIAPDKSAKKYAVLSYWPYAAMLAIGLFLGYYFRGNRSVEVVSAHKIQSMQTLRDTVFIDNALPQADKKIATTPAKRAAKPDNDIKATIEPVEKLPEPLAHEAAVEPPSGEDFTQKTERKEIAVVYFEDMPKSEKALFVTSEKRNRKKFFSIKKPQSNETSMQELPVRNFLYAINK